LNGIFKTALDHINLCFRNRETETTPENTNSSDWRIG